MPIAPGAKIPLLAPAALVGLAIGWGLNWPFMKIAMADIPPWTLRGWSCLIAGLLLLYMARLSGDRILVPPPSEWRVLALAALFNISAWNILVTNGVLLIASSHAALLGYTMPMWAVLIARFAGEPIGRRGIAALVLGLSGIFALLARDLGVLGESPVGAGMVLGGAIAWAIGTVIQKHRRTVLSTLALAGWQFILGSLPILAFMPLFEGVHFPRASAIAWGAALFGLLISFCFCYWVWFQMVRILPVQIASISTLLVPIVGVVSGAWLLDEPFGERELLALALICSGLALILFAPPRRAPG